MNKLSFTPLQGYSLFTALYFSTLFLISQVRLEYSKDFYDPMLSNIQVSMDIFYFTGIFWAAIFCISGLHTAKSIVNLKKWTWDLHSILFLLSSSLVACQICCAVPGTAAA